jgi:hypothetical protein
VAAGKLELRGGAQPIFVFFPKSTKNKYTTTFGNPTAQKICSNYSIRRWSFLFIFFAFIIIFILSAKTLFYFRTLNFIILMKSRLVSFFFFLFCRSGISSSNIVVCLLLLIKDPLVALSFPSF